MSKIYVASAFSNRHQVQAVMELLSDQGHEITHDWTTGDETADTARFREYAAEDLAGIDRADMLFLIAHPDMRGALVEMGYAIALKKPVILVYPSACANIFKHFLPPTVRWAPSITEGVRMARSTDGEA